jgi:hypothetical protein
MACRYIDGKFAYLDSGTVYLEIGPSALIVNGIHIQIMDVLSFGTTIDNKDTDSLKAVETMENIWTSSKIEQDRIIDSIFKC